MSMKGRSSALLTLMALSAVPAGAAWGGPVSASTANAASSTATTHKYKGASVDTRWGPVQVTIYVKNKKITNVKTSMALHTRRSEIINSEALPLLKQEVLQAQSADIDELSGATDTSDAFMESLQSAIKKAQKQKTLKQVLAA